MGGALVGVAFLGSRAGAGRRLRGCLSLLRAPPAWLPACQLDNDGSYTFAKLGGHSHTSLGVPRLVPALFWDVSGANWGDQPARTGAALAGAHPLELSLPPAALGPAYLLVLQSVSLFLRSESLFLRSKADEDPWLAAQRAPISPSTKAAWGYNPSIQTTEHNAAQRDRGEASSGFTESELQVLALPPSPTGVQVEWSKGRGHVRADAPQAGKSCGPVVGVSIFRGWLREGVVGKKK